MPQGFTRRALGGLLAVGLLLVIWRTSQYQEQPLSPSIFQSHRPDTKIPNKLNGDAKAPEVKLPDVKISEDPDVKIPDVKPPDFKTDDGKPGDIKIKEPKIAEVSRRRVGKVSMLYGYENLYYERALESHQRHADRWNYPMHVLEEDISVGYWNKPSYVLSLVIQELAKSPDERLEWLM